MNTSKKKRWYKYGFSTWRFQAAAEELESSYPGLFDRTRNGLWQQPFKMMTEMASEITHMRAQDD